MITEKLLEIVLVPLSTLLGLLPDFNASPHDGAGALGTIASAFRFMSVWFVMPALLGVFGLWVTIEAGLITARLLQWVYAKIPFKAT